MHILVSNVSNGNFLKKGRKQMLEVLTVVVAAVVRTFSLSN